MGGMKIKPPSTAVLRINGDRPLAGRAAAIVCVRLKLGIGRQIPQ
jgi:hypothetical protein